MSITPTHIVLLQELERFNRLLIRMENSLTLLRRALAGEIGMDLKLDNIATSIFNGQIPDDWRKLAPDTCKSLSSWMEHLNRRAVQYRYWSSSGEPLVMWLSGLHVPESFLTALVQIACRRNNWPLDRSTLFTAVTDYAEIDDVEERVETVSLSRNSFIALLNSFLFLVHRDVTFTAYILKALTGAFVSDVSRDQSQKCLSNRCQSCQFSPSKVIGSNCK